MIILFVDIIIDYFIFGINVSYIALTEPITLVKGKINVLTDNGEINFQVFRRRVSEVDPASIDTFVTLSKILKCQLRRRACTKRRPVAPKMRGAPQFRLSELPTSRVVTATQITGTSV